MRPGSSRWRWTATRTGSRPRSRWRTAPRGWFRGRPCRRPPPGSTGRPPAARRWSSRAPRVPVLSPGSGHGRAVADRSPDCVPVLRDRRRRPNLPRSEAPAVSSRIRCTDWNMYSRARYPGRVTVHAPPGWPVGVHPPGSDGFEETAVTWLLDVVPADYRLHGVLRRYPVALATLARH